MASPRALIAFAAAILAPSLPGAGPSLAPYEAVDVPLMKTNAYVATVSLSTGRFRRENGAFLADYKATVFPYFFLAEKGRLVVSVPDDALRRVERGESVTFTGRAVRSDGTVRPIDGRASPIDAQSGKIKVRVAITRRVILVFNTTYRLAGPPR